MQTSGMDNVTLCSQTVGGGGVNEPNTTTKAAFLSGRNMHGYILAQAIQGFLKTGA